MSDVPDVVGHLDHEQKQTARYIEVSPAHGDRKETSLFKHARASLVLHYGCYIDNAECDHGSPLEAHHYFTEWSKTNAVDWVKFRQFVEKTHLVNPQNGMALSEICWPDVMRDPATFVDSSYNLVILCAEHHRSMSNGIHHLPYSIWLLQRYLVDGFDISKPYQP